MTTVTKSPTGKLEKTVTTFDSWDSAIIALQGFAKSHSVTDVIVDDEMFLAGFGILGPDTGWYTDATVVRIS